VHHISIVSQNASLSALRRHQLPVGAGEQQPPADARCVVDKRHLHGACSVVSVERNETASRFRTPDGYRIRN
jgi:hypothetical protein